MFCRGVLFCRDDLVWRALDLAGRLEKKLTWNVGIFEFRFGDWVGGVVASMSISDLKVKSELGTATLTVAILGGSCCIETAAVVMGEIGGRGGADSALRRRDSIFVGDGSEDG